MLVFWATTLGQAVLPGVLLARGARLCAADGWLLLGQGATLGLALQGLAVLAGRALAAPWLACARRGDGGGRRAWASRGAALQRAPGGLRARVRDADARGCAHDHAAPAARVGAAHLRAAPLRPPVPCRQCGRAAPPLAARGSARGRHPAPLPLARLRASSRGRRSGAVAARRPAAGARAAAVGGALGAAGRQRGSGPVRQRARGRARRRGAAAARDPGAFSGSRQGPSTATSRPASTAARPRCAD